MPLEQFEKAVDQVTDPSRVGRLIMRMVILFVLVAVGLAVGRACIQMTRKLEVSVTGREWFVEQEAAIKEAASEEAASLHALKRQRADVASRSGFFSFSRKEDREQTARLNQAVVAAHRRRARLIQEYNSRAAQVTDSTLLKGMPKEISDTCVDEAR